MHDALRRRRADLARQIEGLDRVTAFADALRSELGIEAELDADDGDLILVIPQVLPRDVAETAEPPQLAAPEPRPVTPDPEPQESVVSAPAELPRTPAAVPTRNGLPWEHGEDERIVEATLAGLRAPEIAAELGRTKAAVAHRIAHQLRDRIAQARNARLRKPAERVAAAEPAPAPSPSAPHAAPAMTGAPGWLRELRARLDALGHAAPWTPELDHRLAAGLCAGRRLDDLAQALGVTPQGARSRWRMLLPEPGIDAQTRLLAELKQRRDAAQGAIAAE